jgi:hypothetical protein
MKKQILFLAMFTMALIFAGTTISYAQCVEDALHPIAGKEYTYSVAISGLSFTPADGTYIWYVTSNPNIITAGTLNIGNAITPANNTIIVGSGYTYAGSGGVGQLEIKLTWSAEAIAAATAATPTRYYLVIHNTNDNTAGATDCNVMNTHAWDIMPINIFNITIENVIADGTLQPLIEECVAPIYTATINPNTLPAVSTMTYDYGENALYFKLTAFNFTTSWTPSIVFSGMTGSTISSAEWSTTTTFSGTNPLALASGVWSAVVPAVSTNTSAGEAIYVKFVVDHDAYETLVRNDIVITVNGKDFANNDDVNPADCTVSATDDQVTQTLLPRPTVTPTPAPFILP